ncbi:nucleoside hydrolase [Mycoplasmatota bacterium WC44]
MKRNIIIDCDPGHDDMLAIMVALSNKDKLNLLGVTTVGGNQTIDKVTKNALEILNFLEEGQVPVAKGFKDPILRKLDIAKGKEIHGETGLGGYTLPETDKKIEDLHAVDFLYKTIMENERVTLVPTGPLTNIGLLLKAHPEVSERIELISLMGGSIYSGNVTPHAEFNIWADPDAAKIVFNSGVNIVMAGLECTHKANLTYKEIETLAKSEKETAKVIGKLNSFHAGFFMDEWKFDGAPIHDACSVMYLVYPEIFKKEKYNIDVETNGEFIGKTFTDLRDWAKHDDSSTEVLVDVDRVKFSKYLHDSIDYFDNEH